MDDFTLVGARPQDALPLSAKTPWYKGKPVISILVLGLIVLGCLLWSAFSKTDAGYMGSVRLQSRAEPQPSFRHRHDGARYFRDDLVGREAFSIIGVCSTLLSTFIAVFFGSLSGCAGERLGGLLTRVNEIFISIPNLLLIVLFAGHFGAGQRVELIDRHRPHQLDEHREGRAHGGARAARKRIRAGRAVHGRKLFTSCASILRPIFSVHFIYGHHECARCDARGVDAELSGARFAA